jgi:hypothetical protein
MIGSICMPSGLCVCTGNTPGTCPTGSSTGARFACKDLNNDPNNCGDCGHVCPQGGICQAAECHCPPNKPYEKNGQCLQNPCDHGFDPVNDNSAQGYSCQCLPPKELSPNGNCIINVCSANNQIQTNTISSAASTSGGIACGNQCCSAPPNGTPVCSQDGQCSFTCNSGFTACNGQCIDTTSDPANCGGCGNACAAPTGGTATCNSGQCSQECPSGQEPFNGACVPKCQQTSTHHDPRFTQCVPNCPGNQVNTEPYGICGCPTNSGVTQSVCGDSCVDTNTDANNCGGCGIVCGQGTTCDVGACKCPIQGQVYQNGQCQCPTGTELSSDGSACLAQCPPGTAGQTCPGGEACSFLPTSLLPGGLYECVPSLTCPTGSHSITCGTSYTNVCVSNNCSYDPQSCAISCS